MASDGWQRGELKRSGGVIITPDDSGDIHVYFNANDQTVSINCDGRVFVPVGIPLRTFERIMNEASAYLDEVAR